MFKKCLPFVSNSIRIRKNVVSRFLPVTSIRRHLYSSPGVEAYQFRIEEFFADLENVVQNEIQPINEEDIFAGLNEKVYEEEDDEVDEVDEDILETNLDYDDDVYETEDSDHAKFYLECIEKFDIVASLFEKQIQRHKDKNTELELLLKSLKAEYNGLADEQLRLEQRSLSDAVERYKRAYEGAIDRNDGSALSGGARLLSEWFGPLTESIRNEQRKVHLTSKLPKFGAPQYLTAFQPEKLAVLTIHQVLGMCLREKSVPFTKVVQAVGNAVHAELNHSRLKKIPQAKRLDFVKNRMLVYRINRTASLLLHDNVWSSEIITSVGAFLVNLLLNVAKITTTQHGPEEDEIVTTPGFVHIVKMKNGKMTGFIEATDALKQSIMNINTVRETMEPRHLPMLVPPKRWTYCNEGGYLTLKSLVMRTKGSRLQEYILENADMEAVFEGLNVLNETAWKINEPVFRVFERIWEDGGGLGDLPSRKDIPLPPKPDTTDESLIYKWRRETKKIKQKNADLHSLRCDTMYKLQVAREFLGKTMYFPHNVDFRGRSYPIPPHLNHMGADINRGLLRFDVGKPITRRGIYWLKIHLANLCGFDKATFEDRIKFVECNMENIRDSAENPLDGRRWWLTTENPWQVLAACFELNNCLKSPNPEAYISHLPIQLDGSCNGLQHYAALGRDNLGALHVNLLPTERPMDVYTSVLNVVLKLIEKDAKEGNECAKVLLGKVTRSTIKQTVMTSVYGVTRIGAREQIQKQLKLKQEIPEEMLHNCAMYLSGITLHSLGEVFQSAKNIMAWLNECAYLIGSRDEPVLWVTPLGLPVVQPYRAPKKYQVKTILQTVSLVRSSEELPVHVLRQRSAFPPNYVHSLDASHMFMCARKAKEHGIVFASVHDSFWSHAQNADKLGELIRETFIELHSQPLLETLRSSFEHNYPGTNFPPVPRKGSLDLNRVKQAQYFFD